ncbi:PE-PPE domain-containing protein [Mycobacterium sp. RTGN5]|uniref:PE-PPE domain-containing protein n=1 Tax=Mycobacterium sp. RTGN5 TaxID=3016522 RepID=UPI0029C81E7B|nr:PE-PPE domain-containing protein [Mycobacterium sp. RTGN5]
MSAAGFVGRVGGLAVALGVGAAAFNGAVAWADSSGPGNSSTHASSTHSASSAGSAAGPAKKAAPKRTRATASVRAQSITPVATASAAASTGTSTPDAPVAPADSALEVAALAYSRRDSGLSARPTAASSPAPEVSVQAAAAVGPALIMGASGHPIPTPTYIQSVMNLYIHGPYPDALPFQLDTPEGLYPITGVKSLPLNVSVQQGLDILGAQVLKEWVAGNHPVVFGYSQSSIISSLFMAQLPADQRDDIDFVLVGNEMNPRGGLLSRFPGLNLPSLGINFGGATPVGNYNLTNYTLAYDGFADFPRYPLNFLSVLNAGLGIIFVHTQYANLTPEDINSAILLNSSEPTEKYYIIQHPDLPLLEPLRLIPVIGNPIADLLQPALSVIVNLGYGDPEYGWSNDGNANEQQPFGFLPAPEMWGKAARMFVDGIGQGIEDFAADISPGGIMSRELAALKPPTPGPLTLPTPTGLIPFLQNSINDVAYNISNSSAALYAALLPTADLANAVVTMLPAYAVYVFLEGIQQALSGDVINGLVNAIGRPLAASVGLVTTAGLIEALVLLQAVQGFLGQETDV